MLYAGLDLSRKRLDFCLLDEAGELIERGAVPPDRDGLCSLAERVAAQQRQRVVAAVESMTGARFVHDQLESHGWRVEVADAARVRGLAPLACKTDRIDAWALAELCRRELVPAIWLPDGEVRGARERARFRLHLVKHRTALKNRIHQTLVGFGTPCPVSDLFGERGRRLLARLELPQPWAGSVAAPARRQPPIRAAAADRARDRLDPRLHDRGRDRRHQPLHLTSQAGRLHRPLPTRLPIR